MTACRSVLGDLGAVDGQGRSPQTLGAVAELVHNQICAVGKVCHAMPVKASVDGFEQGGANLGQCAANHNSRWVQQA